MSELSLSLKRVMAEKALAVAWSKGRDDDGAGCRICVGRDNAIDRKTRGFGGPGKSNY
jgi:hypothetical protein